MEPNIPSGHVVHVPLLYVNNVSSYAVHLFALNTTFIALTITEIDCLAASFQAAALKFPERRCCGGSGRLRPAEKRLFRSNFPLSFGSGSAMRNPFILTET